MPTINILVVSPDPKLHDEFRSSLRGLGDRAPVPHFATELRTGIEAARSRQPEVVLVEMGLNLSALKAFADEIAASAPAAVLVAVFRPEVIGNDMSEGAVLIEAIRCGVKDFLRRPISTTELDQILARASSRGLRQASRLGAVASFISNKGGVGKSTLAVNAAVVLARKHPQRVLLIDASLQLGVAASMLDLHPATTLTDAVQERERLDESFSDSLPCSTQAAYTSWRRRIRPSMPPKLTTKRSRASSRWPAALTNSWSWIRFHYSIESS